MADDNSVILSVLNAMSGQIKDLTTAINSLTKCSVVREDCERYMGSHELRIRDLEVKLGAMQALQSTAVDGAELITAKNDAVKEANGDKKELYEKLDQLDNRLATIETTLKMAQVTWKTVKENPVFLSAFAGGGLILTGVLGGRGLDLIALYGTHAVVLGVAIVALGLILTWLGRRKAKKTLNKWGFLPIIFILFITSSTAQESNMSSFSEIKPVLLSPESYSRPPSKYHLQEEHQYREYQKYHSNLIGHFGATKPEHWAEDSQHEGDYKEYKCKI